MKTENCINYACFDVTGKRVFDCKEICVIDRIEFISIFHCVNVVFQLPAGLITSRIVGTYGTYVKYKGNKYETMKDYYKLQQVIEKEKIKNILDDMNKG